MIFKDFLCVATARIHTRAVAIGEVKVKKVVHCNTMPSNDCSVRNDIRAKWGMIIGYGQLLVAIIVADVDPLPAIPAPAPIPVRGIAVSERYAKEREVIESIDEKTSVAETILKAVAAVLIEKTSIDESIPASEGCAD